MSFICIGEAQLWSKQLIYVLCPQSNTAELSKLREQLSASKQDRNSLQGGIAQLKTALQSTVEAAKVTDQ